jgi:hypothetical protein
MDTVQINDPKKPGDFLVINRRDFDPARHTLYGSKPAPAPVAADTPAETPKPAPAPRKPRR